MTRHTAHMALSGDEHRRWQAQVRDLTATERHDELSPDEMRRTIDEVNEHRRAADRPPLVESPEPPEAEFYARARSLGLRRISR